MLQDGAISEDGEILQDGTLHRMGRFTGLDVAQAGAISNDGTLHRMERFHRMGRCTRCGDFTTSFTSLQGQSEVQGEGV